MFVAEAFHEFLRGIGDAVGLVEADVVAVLEFRRGLFAHVFVEAAADKVVEHPVAQGGLGYRHFADFQLFEGRHHDRQTAGKHFHALRFQVLEFGFFHRTRSGDAFGQFLHAFVGDVGFLRIFDRQHVADGFGRTGGADGEVPACALHQLADALDFVARGGDGRLKVFIANFVLEKTHTVCNATQRQAFGMGRPQVGADDELGRAAADVDNQHPVAVGRQGVDDAGVNQACLFAARNHFYRKPQRGFGFGNEAADIFGNAESVGRHDAHLFRLEAAQPFAEFGQTFQGAFLRFFAQVFLFVQTGGKAHHLFEGIDDFQLAVVVFANLEAETVGT